MQRTVIRIICLNIERKFALIKSEEGQAVIVFRNIDDKSCHDRYLNFIIETASSY